MAERVGAIVVGAGVADLVRLDAAQARSPEPELACAGALLSPSTGIVVSQALMQALLGEAEEHGALLAAASPVTRSAQLRRPARSCRR